MGWTPMLPAHYHYLFNKASCCSTASVQHKSTFTTPTYSAFPVSRFCITIRHIQVAALQYLQFCSCQTDNVVKHIAAISGRIRITHSCLRGHVLKLNIRVLPCILPLHHSGSRPVLTPEQKSCWTHIALEHPEIEFSSDRKASTGTKPCHRHTCLPSTACPCYHDPCIVG
jgi:hypothetical protein